MMRSNQPNWTSQAMRQDRPDAWQALQHVKPARRETLRLSIKPSKNVVPRAASLIGQILEHPEGVVRSTRMEHRKPPHRGQRNDGAFNRVRVNLRRVRACRAFDQDDPPVRAMGKPRRLREQSSVHQRGGEVRDRLPFDEHLVVNQVVAGPELDHLQVEGSALANDIEQPCIALGISTHKR